MACDNVNRNVTGAVSNIPVATFITCPEPKCDHGTCTTGVSVCVCDSYWIGKYCDKCESIYVKHNKNNTSGTIQHLIRLYRNELGWRYDCLFHELQSIECGETKFDV